MALDFGDLEVTTLPQDENADGKGVCPDCGKTLTITAAGNLRQHKCVGEIDSSGKAKPPSRGSKGRTPKKVRALGVAAVASGVEWTASNYVARATDLPVEKCAPACDLGDDADIMIGPFLELLWPKVPKGAQRIITDLANESDLLLAAMAWWEWGTKVREFTTSVQAEKGQRNGTTQPAESGVAGGGRPIGLVPFTPDSASTEAF